MTGATRPSLIGTDNSSNAVTGAADGARIVQAGSVQGDITFVTSPSVPPPRIPRQLPGPTWLVDRVEEAAQLTNLLLPRENTSSRAADVLVVLGPSGWGKSTLVHNWVHAHADAFPGGQLYAKLAALGSGADAVSETLGLWLIDLGVDPAVIPASPHSRSALLRTATHGRDMIAVVDGVGEVTDVGPLLLTPSAGVTVMTARVAQPQLVMDGVRRLFVPPLPDEAAIALLHHRVGAQRARDETHTIAKLVKTFHGHAYTIGLAGALLELHPRRPVADVLSSFASPTDAPRGVAAIWETMLMTATEDLPVDAATILGVCRSIAQSADADVIITHEAAAVILGQTADPPAAEAMAAVSALHERSLAGDTGITGLFVIKAMALQHSAGLTRPPQDPHSAIERLGEHYLMRTACAVATTEPGKHRYTGIDEANLQRFTDEHTALAWFHAQLPLLTAIYEACARWGLDALTVRFADALWPMLRQIGQYNLQAKAQQTAAAAAERIDHPYWSVVLSRVGWALTHLDQAEQAIDWCTRGLALAELCPAKHFAAGTALSTRSRAYAELGQFDLAINDLQGARAEDHAHGSPNWVDGLRLRLLGWYLVKAGRGDEALPVAEEAVALSAPDARRPKETGSAYQSLGRVCSELGLYARAVGAFTAALDIFSRHPHHVHQANTHEELAVAYEHLGMHDSAAVHAGRADAVKRAIVNSDAAAEVSRPAPNH